MSDYFDARKDSPALRHATEAFSRELLDQILPALRLAARGKGYALAVHGTQARDIDFLAVPWTLAACTADELLDALLGALAAAVGPSCVHTRKDGEYRVRDWCETKPHGRRAIIIILPGMCPEIDLSVMPRIVESEGP